MVPIKSLEVKHQNMTITDEDVAMDSISIENRITSVPKKRNINNQQETG